MHDKRARRDEVIHALEEAGGARPGAAREVMEATGIPEADVYGVATFYELLRRPGLRRVCTGTSCALRGADALLAEEQAGGAVANSCLGQCDRAPAMLDADLELVAAAPRGAVMPDDPDLPINLGGADTATYEALAARLGDRPLSLIPGNHDDPAALAAVFPEAFEGAGRGFAEVVDGWLLIGFDSHVPGQIAGRVDAAQCALAEERLAAHPHLPVVFFVHHPPAPIGAEWLDAMGLVDSPTFDALVQTHAPRIAAVVCGHVHQDREVTLHGVPVLTTPSTAFQFAVGTAEPGFDALPPGLRVLELGEALKTRVVRLDRQEHAPVHPGSDGY